MAEAERWNRVYANEPGSHSAEPNALLVEVARTLRPGRALDIGMGQGRNAVFLAQSGWRVTGVEISAEGARQASSMHAGIDVIGQRIEDFDLGCERWDLIAGIYVHGVLLRESARITAALSAGGVLVVEGFHRDVTTLGIAGLTGGTLGYQSNALLHHFQDLRIVRYEDRIALADWWGIAAPIVRMVARKGTECGLGSGA